MDYNGLDPQKHTCADNIFQELIERPALGKRLPQTNLMNSGGFQIGHWGFLLADIFAGLNGIRQFPKACELFLTDSVATRHRLRQVKKDAKRSTYMHTSLAVIENMTGIVFELSDQIPKCRASAFIVADALKIPTQWSNLT